MGCILFTGFLAIFANGDSPQVENKVISVTIVPDILPIGRYPESPFDRHIAPTVNPDKEANIEPVNRAAFSLVLVFSSSLISVAKAPYGRFTDV